ncbi:phage tail assembly protein [Perlucidibaca piscinae]|uniref:phage tail assembly protein n=1 Tax=Perlucidibaca piscinae TaxID=392589 RepID=UPI0003B3A3CB|nr:phage tail assembly protein [Perlucidibaca piscinae]
MSEQNHMPADQQAQTESMKNPNLVTLDEPLQRGTLLITEIEVRKPKAGALRGLQLVDVLRMDVDALRVLLPRITTPALTAQDVLELDPADLLQLGAKVSDFLLPKDARQEASLGA